MRKWLMLLGVVAAGVAAVVFLRRRSSGYEGDAIDSARGSGTFGERPPHSPEEQMAPIHTEQNVSAEQLSMASRIGDAEDAITSVWPSLTHDDISAANGDLDKLAQTISEKTGEPAAQAKKRLEDVLAQTTPPQSYPAH